MRTLNKILLLIVTISFFSCSETDDKDDQKPEIIMTGAEVFPNNCDTLYFGETFTFRTHFSDNQELGSYSISIHNNFNHHSHSTELTECTLSPIKAPVNPLTFIEDYSIPDGTNEYEVSMSLEIPLGEGTELFDDGDYHFFIRLTDKAGWSEQKGLSIKILHR
ncbi:MAG: DUF4625 domain-containing protein [Draconibacterium sp.]